MRVQIVSKVRAVSVVAALLALAGCNAGGGSAPASSGGGGNLVSQALFGNPQNIPKASSPETEIDMSCPAVGVMEGAAAFRVGRGGSSDVAHQASLTDVARECRYMGTQMSVKVGVQGRMLIGAAGKPGTYTVPVRVAIKKDEKVVASRFTRVSVTIPAGEGSVSFTHVEDNIIVPLTPRVDPGEEYEIYVGFDANGTTADPRSGRRRR